MEDTNTKFDAIFAERVCGTCEKKFMITASIRQYMYKIKLTSKNIQYFCCYTHYKAGKQKREEEIENNKSAYINRRIAKGWEKS